MSSVRKGSIESGVASVVCATVGYGTMASEVKTRKRKLATAALAAAGGAALAVAIIKPSLERARMTSGRVPCASNLRQVGQALLLYAIDNGRVYPPKLQ